MGKDEAKSGTGTVESAGTGAGWEVRVGECVSSEDFSVQLLENSSLRGQSVRPLVWEPFIHGESRARFMNLGEWEGVLRKTRRGLRFVVLGDASFHEEAF